MSDKKKKEYLERQGASEKGKGFRDIKTDLQSSERPVRAFQDVPLSTQKEIRSTYVGVPRTTVTPGGSLDGYKMYEGPGNVDRTVYGDQNDPGIWDRIEADEYGSPEANKAAKIKALERLLSELGFSGQEEEMLRIAESQSKMKKKK